MEKNIGASTPFFLYHYSQLILLEPSREAESCYYCEPRVPCRCCSGITNNIHPFEKNKMCVCDRNRVIIIVNSTNIITHFCFYRG